MKLRDLLILASGVAAASQVHALSLGNSQGNVQLGAPIDLVFQIQPDQGQTADTSCVSADVWMGDVALRSNQFTVSTQAKSVRVRSSEPVYEPLLTVKLTAGCNGSISRSYSFFADPPSSMAASVQPIDLSQIQVATVPAKTQATPTSTPKPAAQARRAPKRATPPKAAPKPTAAPVTPAVATATATAAATASAALAAPEVGVDDPIIPAPNKLTSATTVAAPAKASAHAASVEKPRLRVEPLEGLEGLDSSGPTATPADDATPVAVESFISPETRQLLDANAARIEALEAQLLALKQQLTNNRRQVTDLQQQLVHSQENPELPVWVYALLGVLALALACIAWLLYRLRQERLVAQQNTWAHTVLSMEDTERETTINTQHLASATAAIAASQELPAAAEANTASADHGPETIAAALEATPLADHQAAEYFDHIQETTPPALAPVTVPTAADMLPAQALFDVQEQAEFYASIGENDQAIAILQAHIAEHQASSPLAYVELLQLLYRLGRVETFEQVREQFQTYFNVRVPDFLGFARKGHDLWNSSPEVLGKIEAKWPTDDVLDMLRNLIVHNNADPAQPRFDMAAFDDLLMLYQVAKNTPANSRGELPGRMRTAPTEVPLPEVSLDAIAPSANTDPVTKPAVAATAPVTTAVAAPVLSLDEAHLDLLSAAPAEEPLTPVQAASDSPFQSNPHIAPNEALVDELSLDWEVPDFTAPSASVPTPAPTPAAATPSPDATALDIELQALMMDERDLPPPPKPKRL